MISPMKRLIFLLSLAMLILGWNVFAIQAQSQSSSNYQNTDSSVIPAEIIQSSTNFKIQAAINAIVGTGNSTGFMEEVGSQTPPGVVTAATTTTGGGGGSAGNPQVTPLLLTLQYHTPTYLSTQKIFGNKDSNIVRVTVNGSDQGVIIDGGTWNMQKPLFLGENSIILQGYTTFNTSKQITGSIDRLLSGDVNRDGEVGDADLSLLVRDWKTSRFRSDFNEDGIVGDADLSIQFAYWTNTY